LANAPAHAGAGDLVEVHVVLCGELADQRRDVRVRGLLRRGRGDLRLLGLRRRRPGLGRGGSGLGGGRASSTFGCGAGAAAGAASPLPMTARTEPTSAVSSSPTRISSSVPAAG